jgi:hypothetical protein
LIIQPNSLGANGHLKRKSSGLYYWLFDENLLGKKTQRKLIWLFDRNPLGYENPVGTYLVVRYTHWIFKNPAPSGYRTSPKGAGFTVLSLYKKVS